MVAGDLLAGDTVPLICIVPVTVAPGATVTVVGGGGETGVVFVTLFYVKLNTAVSVNVTEELPLLVNLYTPETETLFSIPAVKLFPSMETLPPDMEAACCAQAELPTHKKNKAAASDLMKYLQLLVCVCRGHTHLQK